MEVSFPEGYRLEQLSREHPRRKFRSGNQRMDDWLLTKALQQQNKRLSKTSVLLEDGEIAGYYTLAMSHVGFGELPDEIRKALPKRLLPAIVLGWLGVSETQQGQGLGTRLLAAALVDCHRASQIVPFIGVVLDALDETTKQFYERFDFQSLPGHSMRMFLTADRLEQMTGE
jgi:predicted N-acetyltransferase YhbS